MLHTRPAPRPPQRYPVRIKVTYLQKKWDSFIAARNQVNFRVLQVEAILTNPGFSARHYFGGHNLATVPRGGLSGPRLGNERQAHFN